MVEVLLVLLEGVEILEHSWIGQLSAVRVSTLVDESIQVNRRTMVDCVVCRDLVAIPWKNCYLPVTKSAPLDSPFRHC